VGTLRLIVQPRNREIPDDGYVTPDLGTQSTCGHPDVLSGLSDKAHSKRVRDQALDEELDARLEGRYDLTEEIHPRAHNCPVISRIDSTG